VNCTGKRLVEPQVGAQLRTLLRRRILAQQVGDGIAHVLEEHECNERHGEHHDHGLDEAA
jgi:hypothetical protein